MAIDIGPKIGIEGEAQYRQELARINQATKVLASEAKAVAAGFDEQTTAEERAARTSDVLNRQIETQREKIAKLTEGLEASARKYGESDARTMKWQQAVYDATAALGSMERQLEGSTVEVEDITDNMEEAEEATHGWADVMKGQLLADAIKTGLSALVDLTKKAGAAAWEAAKGGAAYADEILTLSATTNLGTDQLQRLRYMSDLTDVSLDTLTGALTRTTKNMAAAKDGTGDAAEAWAELGVSILDADGNLRSAEDVMNDTLAALGKIDNDTERDALAMRVLGKSAQDLNPIIKAGAGFMEELGKEAEDSGYVLSGPALKALGKAQDGLDRLNRATEGTKNQFAVGLAPAVEKATGAISDTLTNPRTQRGIELLSQAVGSLLEGLANLATGGLGRLTSALGTVDSRLKNYTDDQLTSISKTKEARDMAEDLHQTYLDDAGSIEAERERTEKLWEELQTLAGKSGEVEDADRDRAQYLLGELNTALGTEYEMNGNIIEQYSEMKQRVADLIDQQAVQALMAAGAEEYANALKEVGPETQRAAQLAVDMKNKQTELALATIATQSALKAYQESEEDLEGAHHPLYDAYQKQLGIENDLRDTLNDLTADYKTSAENVEKLSTTVEQFENAKMEAARGNYKEAREILTGEAKTREQAHKDNEKISKADIQTLKNQYAEQEAATKDYRRKYQEGMAGYTKPVLEEMEKQKDETKRILDAIAAGATTWGEAIGENMSQGLINGMARFDQKVEYQARNQVRKATGAMKEVAMIASPSKVTTGYGEYLGEGLVVGMRRKELAVASEARRLTAAALTGTSGGVDIYSGVSTAALTAGSGATSNSYQTNLGGISMTVYAGDVQNLDQLADKVSAKLTYQIMRAQRGAG